jgi:hypothetical protein
MQANKSRLQGLEIIIVSLDDAINISLEENSTDRNLAVVFASKMET